MLNLSSKTKCVEEFANDNWFMIILPTTTYMQYLDRLPLGASCSYFQQL
jgi:hypothetical protein